MSLDEKKGAGADAGASSPTALSTTDASLSSHQSADASAAGAGEQKPTHTKTEKSDDSDKGYKIIESGLYKGKRLLTQDDEDVRQHLGYAYPTWKVRTLQPCYC